MKLLGTLSLMSNEGLYNTENSQFEFTNIDVVKTIGQTAYEKNDKFYLQVLSHSFLGIDGITNELDRHIDVYLQGLPLVTEQYRSDGIMSQDVYLYSLYHDFSTPKTFNYDDTRGSLLMINRTNRLNMKFSYGDYERKLQPIISAETYSMCHIKVGIYSVD
jgi:hypothetical protein